MIKTRSGDEEDNICVEHSAEEKVNAMFANLGREARKHLNPNGWRWPEIIKCYDLEKKEHSFEHEVMMLPRKSLAHLMFNT